MAHVVRGCLESDFDSATGTCAQEIWIPQQPSLPVLTVADAQSIAVSIAFLWAVAYVYRLVARKINQS